MSASVYMRKGLGIFLENREKHVHVTFIRGEIPLPLTRLIRGEIPLPLIRLIRGETPLPLTRLIRGETPFPLLKF